MCIYKWVYFINLHFVSLRYLCCVMWMLLHSISLFWKWGTFNADSGTSFWTAYFTDLRKFVLKCQKNIIDEQTVAPSISANWAYEYSSRLPIKWESSDQLQILFDFSIHLRYRGDTVTMSFTSEHILRELNLHIKKLMWWTLFFFYTVVEEHLADDRIYNISLFIYISQIILTYRLYEQRSDSSCGKWQQCSDRTQNQINCQTKCAIWKHMFDFCNGSAVWRSVLMIIICRMIHNYDYVMLTQHIWVRMYRLMRYKYKYRSILYVMRSTYVTQPKKN